jgi:GT2 family glycosyltransferase
MPPRILTVVLNWNQPTVTLECLGRLLRGERADSDILVIDNGSSDDSAARLCPPHSVAWELFCLPANLGFTGGMNVGLGEAVRRGYTHVWLLNNDALAEPDCLARLVGAMEHDPALAAVTPRLDGADGLEQHAGARVDWGNGANHPLLSADLAEPIPTGCWLNGTALLLRTDALKRVGFFDPAFFAYWEDVDLCIRLAAQGYRLRAVPEARCLHLGSASTGGGGSPFAHYMMTRNTWLFLRKHVRRAQRLRSLFGVLSAALSVAAGLERRGKPQQASAVLAGAVAALRGCTGPAGPLAVHPALRGFLMRTWWGLVRILNRCQAFAGS